MRRSTNFISWLVLGAGLLFFIDPRGDFPLNDDWQYAYPVQQLVEQGRFEMKGQFAPTIVLQVGWGYLFCQVWGGDFSFTWLRFSTLCLAALAVFLGCRFAKKVTGRRGVAQLLALSLLLNPLFLNLSFSFMTDVPFLALVLGSLFLFWQYFTEDRPFALAGAIVAAAAAFFVRQPGLLLLPAFAVLLAAERRAWGRAAVLLISAFVLYLSWEQAVKPMLGIANNYVPVGDRYLGALADEPVAFFLDIFRRLVRSAIYLGFFSLPLLPFLWRSFQQKKLFRPVYLWPLLAGNLLLFFFLIRIGKTFPFGGNILYNWGLGPELLADVYTFGLANTPRLPAAVMLVLQFLSQLSASWLLLLLLRGYSSFSAAHRQLIWLLVFFNALYLPLMSITSFFDRYLLPCLASLFIALAPLLRVRRPVLAYLPLLLMSLFSILATHDYLSWNRARAQAFRFLQNQGVTIRQMDAGYEYNGFYNYRRDYEHREDRSYWWVDDDTYCITFGPMPGYQTIARLPHPRWLWLTQDHILVLEKRRHPIGSDGPGLFLE